MERWSGAFLPLAVLQLAATEGLYAAYAELAPPRISPHPETVRMVFLFLAFPYAFSLVMATRRRVVWSAVLEAASWLCGGVIIALFAYSVASMCDGRPPHGAVRAVYPVMLLWGVQTGCALISFNLWLEAAVMHPPPDGNVGESQRESEW